MKQLNVGNLPNRKRPTLYVEDRGSIRVIASFRDVEAMREFLAFGPTYTQPEANA